LFDRLDAIDGDALKKHGHGVKTRPRSDLTGNNRTRLGRERIDILTYIIVEWLDVSKFGVRCSRATRHVALSNCEEPEQHGQNGRDI
jgi:hypothetical protein